MSTPAPWKSWHRLRALGWGVAWGCAVIALVRALSARVEPPPRRLSPEERLLVGRACAAEEPGWRRSSVRHFPGDHWSQDDDFHAAERSWALGEARRRQVPPTDVFRAIDEELRTHPVEPPRKATASPCKPRPAYD